MSGCVSAAGAVASHLMSNPAEKRENAGVLFKERFQTSANQKKKKKKNADGISILNRSNSIGTFFYLVQLSSENPIPKMR